MYVNKCKKIKNTKNPVPNTTSNKRAEL